jgi:spermidine synthase
MTQSANSRRFLAPLLVLFAATGCASLIYEIVWFQLLQLVIGSSAVSLGVLLGTFMGGMCAGSALLPRFVSPGKHPLRVYALLEAGIGLYGLAILFGMPAIDRVYSGIAGSGFLGIVVRALVSAICLLPPTFLMGASLPAISRWVQSTAQNVAWLGFFYGGNIAGAVFGCLLAGFYLLRLHDTTVATFIAAAINAAAALLSYLLSHLTTHAPIQQPRLPLPPRAEAAASMTGLNGDIPFSGEVESSDEVVQNTADHRTIAVAVAISGLCALASEVIWTRLLSLIIGGTVYAFSIILAVFLFGLGIGSAAGSVLSKVTDRPRAALAACQLLGAGAIAWTAWTLGASMPFWPVNPSLTNNPWISFQLDLARCAWAVLPAACLWGASFPLALAAAAHGQKPRLPLPPWAEASASMTGLNGDIPFSGEDPARLVGSLYAANTAGAIAGAVGFSMLMIPMLGTQQSQRILIVLSLLAAFVALAPGGRPRIRATGAFAGIAVIAAALFLIWKVPPLPWQLVAFGRQLPITVGDRSPVWLGEGINASVAVTRLTDVRMFHVSGKVEASSQSQDMRLQRMLGHFPAMLHPHAASVLVVGFGAGVTAGSFTVHPSVKRIVVCEIEPLIPKVIARYFSKENYNVAGDPRTEIIYDDGRHYVLTAREQFDIITSDPIHPWVKGNAALYTKEYFEMCKRRLRPGGIVTQWVPLYESSLEAVKSEVATFFEVFPNAVIFSNDFEGEGYDVILLGWRDTPSIDLDHLQRRLEEADHQKVVKSLREAGFGNGIDMMATYAGRARDLRGWLGGAEINRDRNLRLQYLAGLAANTTSAVYIFDDLVAHRRFPEDLFVGSASQKLALRDALRPQEQ